MSNPNFTITTQMETECCYKCGVIFAAPAAFFRQRMKDGRGFWCPNGHGQSYDCAKDSAKREQASLEHRQELILAIHRAEQAEAKAAEAAGTKAVADTSDEAPPQTDSAAQAPTEAEQLGFLPKAPSVKVVDDRMICPHCQRGYRIGTRLARHLRQEHGDDATAKQVYGYAIHKR